MRINPILSLEELGEAVQRYVESKMKLEIHDTVFVHSYGRARITLHFDEGKMYQVEAEEFRHNTK